MPRVARKTSDTGIYHVVMQGVHHQDLFRDEEDYFRFVSTLEKSRLQYDDEGFPCGNNFTLYAYCLMPDHFHLLVRERDEHVSDTIKRIASSYVYFYNQKYERSGHLFRERFKSEPVDDMDYFTVLLRFIHQHPVKAGIVSSVADYEYSSWGEFTGKVESVFQICDTQSVLDRLPLGKLVALVNEPLDGKTHCMDVSTRLYPSDEQVLQMISEVMGGTTGIDFRQLDEERKRAIFRELKSNGASLRQLERLTGIGRGVICRLWS